MAMGNGYDRRYSSIAGDIDAAIERVVAHFEENDVALRLDVLRSLTVHAKLAFESERIKQRLTQHPVTKELIERVTTPSKIYARLHKALVVEEYSCDYDRERNVETQATVRWQLLAASDMKSKSKRRARSDQPLWTRYVFSRVADGESGETVVSFAMSAGVGDGELKQMVKYELASDSPYPRSFYEEDNAMESDGEAEDGSDAEEEEEPEEPEAEEEASGDEDEKDEDMHEEKDAFGEAIRAFDFDDSVLDGILDWLDAEEEELDPSDVISFLLALPIYEDDWMIDERVCQILFNSGGDSEMMEEELVSDFDDEGGEDGVGDEDADVAELD